MKKLQVIEHESKRVLLTEQLAEIYEADVKNIHDNFRNHKDNFIEGKHYYFLEGDNLKAFKDSLPDIIGEPLKYAPCLYLWTERGANRHCKILDTEKAWEQFDRLEETYFNVKAAYQIPKTYAEALRLAADFEEKNQKLISENETMKPKAEFFDAVADSKDAIEMGTAAKVLNMGIGRNDLFKFLRQRSVLMNNNIPYQEYVDRGYFRVIEQKFNKPDDSVHTSTKTLVYQKGLDYIRKLLTQDKITVIGHKKIG